MVLVLCLIIDKHFLLFQDVSYKLSLAWRQRGVIVSYHSYITSMPMYGVIRQEYFHVVICFFISRDSTCPLHFHLSGLTWYLNGWRVSI